MKNINGSNRLSRAALIAVLIFSLNIFLVSAEDETIVVRFTEDGQEISSVRTEVRNAYYVFFSHYDEDVYFVDEEGKKVQLLDAAGSVLYEGEFRLLWFAYYDKNIANIRVLSGTGTTLFEKPLTFCNNDGQCAPCTDTGCTTAENYLTCSDCPSGYFDRLCDLKRDGICDPDCSQMDGDCSACTDTYCFFDDVQDFTCDAFDGEVCEAGEDCVGGEFMHTEDEDPESCCAGGICRNVGEYIETMSRVLEDPENAITPSGARASDVLAKGISNYCFETMGGEICGPEQDCEGENIEYYYGEFCCVGDCITDQSLMMTEAEYLREAIEEDRIPFVPEDIEYIENISEEELADEEMVGEFIPFEDYEDFESRELQHDAVDEDLTVGVLEGFRERAERVTQAVPEAISGFSLPIIALSLLVLAVVMVIFVAVFRRSANKKMGSEEAKALQPAPKAVDLQSTINSLVSRGYDYKQIKNILLNKGHRQEEVSAEIMKNYRARKEAQTRQR
jgi:hypothetical protein